LILIKTARTISAIQDVFLDILNRGATYGQKVRDRDLKGVEHQLQTIESGDKVARVDEAPRQSHQLKRPTASLFLSPVTLCLVALNTVAFIFVRSASPLNLENYGASWGPLTISGQWWRLLTSQFIHLKIGHLLINVLALWLFGQRMERLLGRWVFFLFYLSCGLVGGIVLLAFRPDALGYGASLGI
jgi:membrane associated rhomboid family serine protease